MTEVRLLKDDYIRGGARVGQTFHVSKVDAEALVKAGAAERIVEIVIPEIKESKPRARKLEVQEEG